MNIEQSTTTGEFPRNRTDSLADDLRATIAGQVRFGDGPPALYSPSTDGFSSSHISKLCNARHRQCTTGLPGTFSSYMLSAKFN